MNDAKQTKTAADLKAARDAAWAEMMATPGGSWERKEARFRWQCAVRAYKAATR